MSYKFDITSFVSKKAPISAFEFDAGKKKITDIYAMNRAQNKFIKRVLKGKEKIAEGRMMINDRDSTGPKFIKSNTEIIGNDKWINRLIPPKFVLYFSLVFDLSFLRQARVKFYDKKYDYLSFKDSGNDLEDMKLRRKIDSVISQFVNDATKAETKLLDDYYKKIKKINIEKAKKIFSDYSKNIQIQVLAIAAANISEKLDNANLLLTFFQSLWDKIYAFNDYRNSCTCEFNVKESANREMKNYIDKLKYTQSHFMVKKQLKYIGVRITELRYEIYNYKRTIKETHKQTNAEINKFNRSNKVDKFKISKLMIDRTDWNKLREGLRIEFEKEQREIAFDLLTYESSMIGKRIIFLTHEYHTNILAGGYKPGNPNEFKILKKHYKDEIDSVLSQMVKHTQGNLEKLDIKFDWYLKNGFKVSSLNMIYLKILRAINLNKNNIIFENRLVLLTKNDIAALEKTIAKMAKEYPEFTFITLADNIQEIPILSYEVYAANEENKIVKMPMSKLYNDNAKMIREKFFNTWNVMDYRLVENGIEIESLFLKINTTDAKPFGKVFLNPLEITAKSSNNPHEVPIEVKIKASNKYVDRRMYAGITSRGHRIQFYSIDKKFEVNRKYVVYIQPEAVAELF